MKGGAETAPLRTGGSGRQGLGGTEWQWWFKGREMGRNGAFQGAVGRTGSVASAEPGDRTHWETPRLPLKGPVG